MLATDVDSIIRDLVEIAIKQTRNRKQKSASSRRRIWPRTAFSTFCYRRRAVLLAAQEASATATIPAEISQNAAEGKLDDKEIDIELDARKRRWKFAPPAWKELTSQIQSMFQNMGSSKRNSANCVSAEAFKMLVDEEALKLLNEMKVKNQGPEQR